MKQELQTSQQSEAKIIQKYERHKKIGFFTFFALTSSMIINLYEYASFASVGWALILFLFIAGLCWFIPIAIMAAEMATVKKWESGGLYQWIKATLSPRFGFAAIFFQWFSITIAFIPMLIFITEMFSYALGGSSGLKIISGISLYDADSESFARVTVSQTWSSVGAMFGVMLLIFVSIAVSQLFGVKYTVLISRICFISGILIPLLILVVFGFIYIGEKGVNNNGPLGFFSGTSSSNDSLAIINKIGLFTPFALAFLGIEASANEIKILKNPKRNYPGVMLLLVLSAITFASVGSSLMALIVHNEKIGNLSTTVGILQSLLLITRQIFSFHAASIVVRILAFVLGLAIVGQISCWIVSPSTSLQYAITQGFMSKSLAKLNRFGVPARLVLLQGLCVLTWITVVIIGLIGGVSVANTAGGKDYGGSGVGFLSAMKLTVIMYLLNYFMISIGFIKKNSSKQFDNGLMFPSEFEVVKNKKIKLAIAILCLLSTTFIYISSFLPPTKQEGDSFKLISKLGVYYGIIFAFYLPSIAIPFVIGEFSLRKQKKLTLANQNL